MHRAALVLVLLAGSALGQDAAPPDAPPETAATAPQESDAPPDEPEPDQPVSRVPR